MVFSEFVSWTLLWLLKSSPRGKNLVSSPILTISLANCLELMPVFDVFCCSENSNKKSGLFGPWTQIKKIDSVWVKMPSSMLCVTSTLVNFRLLTSKRSSVVLDHRTSSIGKSPAASSSKHSGQREIEGDQMWTRTSQLSGCGTIYFL